MYFYYDWILLPIDSISYWITIWFLPPLLEFYFNWFYYQLICFCFLLDYYQLVSTSSIEINHFW